MSGTSILSVKLPADVRDRLGRLAETTRRPESALAAEAITAYVAHEAAIIESLRRGLDDMAAGRIVPHADAMRTLEAAIAAAESKER